MGEDGQGNRWEENGRSALLEVERDGRVRLPTTTASRVRHLQELRRAVARRFHGRQRCGHVGQGHLVRAKERCGCGWQEKVRAERAPEPVHLPKHFDFVYSLIGCYG